MDEVLLSLRKKRHIINLLMLFPEEEIIKSVYSNLVTRLFKANVFSREEAQDFVFERLKAAISLGFTNLTPLMYISNELIVPTLNSISTFKNF